MKLIFIHGRSQEGKDPVALLKDWQDAWALGLHASGLNAPDVIDVKLPFYGDELDRLMRESDLGTLDHVRARGAVSNDELAFKYQVLDEMAQACGISPGTINESYDGAARERGPLNWEWVQAVLRTLDKTPLGARSLDRFTHDVYVYLRVPAVRDAIDRTVSSVLDGQPCVVVGHSLGSIVGYNVLRACPSTFDVRRYVTVGSPLGVRAVQNCLDLPLERPECVKDWYNAMDPRDVVALRPLDRETFPVTPEIRNKKNVNNKTENRHGIIGYLDDPEVAREILTAVSEG